MNDPIEDALIRMVFSRARLECKMKKRQAAWEELEQRIEALQRDQETICKKIDKRS